jgi:hypothetical protein
MYNELGFILRSSRTTPSPTTTTKSKFSFMSYVNEMVRNFLGQTQLSGPSVHQVAFPIDKRVAIAWPYYYSFPIPLNILICPARCPASPEPTHTPYTSKSIGVHTPNRTSQDRIAQKSAKYSHFQISNSKFSGFRPGLFPPLYSLLSQLGNQNSHFLYHFKRT